jgi:hypothetical protein
MTITITLSWFHRKIGPSVYYEYPDSNLQPEDLAKIPDLMDTKFEEGFFHHSFTNLYLFNYFFEIESKWARGHKEMLLMSVCFTDPISTQIQHDILIQCIDFANRLKETADMYKAFYKDSSPSSDFSIENEQDEIVKKYKKLILWIRDVYWNIVSFSREKFEEEITAELLNLPSVYEIIKFLSKGPVAKEVLLKWYNQQFPELNLEELLSKLEAQKFIFQNLIGHDTFVLLVKDVKVQRTAPNCIITLIQEKPELADLTEEFTERVGNFFERYKETSEDSKELVKLVANPEIYNVILQLRTGPVPKDQIMDMIESEPVKNLIEILNVLKEKKIIDEFNYNGEFLVLLIDDIQFITTFPDYLSKLTSTKPSIEPPQEELKREIKIKSVTPLESGLENLGEDVFSKLKKISKEKSSDKDDE